MSDKSNKSTKSRVSSLEDIAAKQAQLAKQMEELKNQEQEIRNARLKEIETKINALPEHFGVATLEDVRALIARHVKGVLFIETHGKTGERAPRVSLDDAQKAALIEDRKAGMQYSALAEKYGVSTQTVFNYAKAAGLTESRTSATAPTA